MSFYRRVLSLPPTVSVFIILVGLVSLLLLPGCPAPGPDPDGGSGSCQSKSDCPDGEVCRAKKCVVPTNVAPNADAGPDQNILLKEKVTLDARNSYDEDGDSLTFVWSFKSKPEGSQVKIDGADQSQCSFTPDKPGKYVVLLEASDGTDKAQDEVLINVEKGENTPPEAKIKGDAEITVAVGATVQLDGSESADKDGDALTYKWTLAGPAGSSSSLSDATVATPTFDADMPGDYTITLTVNDGEVDSAVANLTVKAVQDFDKTPKITSLDPAKAPTDSITEVRILGMDLVKDAVVLFRSRELPTTYVSNTELKLSLELLGVTVGKYPVIVKNPNGKQSDPVELEVIEVPTPTITELAPNKAGQNAKFTMEIKGTGFLQSTKAYFTGTELQVTYKSETLIEVQVDLTGRAIGTYPVSLENPGGKRSNSVNFEVTIPPPPPEITILNPDRGKSGEKIDFTVFGKRFDSKSVIIFDGKPIPTISVGGGELKADPKLDLSNVPAGTYKVKVRDNFGIESAEEDFVVTDQYPTPKITSMSPAFASAETKVKVGVSGTDIDPGVKAYFNNKPVTATFKTNVLVEIELDLTGVAVGKYDVYVENPGPSGTTRKSNTLQFEVKPLPPPSVTSVLYSALYSETIGAIIVTGQGFTPATVVQTTSSGQSSSSTSRCGATSLNFVDRATTYVSGTQLIATFKMPKTTSSSYRYYGLKVRRGTTLSNVRCFNVQYSGTVPKPTISGLNPVAVVEGTTSPVAVQIKGTNFDRVATVLYKNKAISPVKYVSASQLDVSFDITGMKAGDTADVQVKNPSGNATSVVKFSIVKQGQPIIQAISPGTIYAGSTNTLTITGQGFDSMATIEADGKAITGTVQFLSSTQMRVTGYVAPPGKAGTISVVVVNPNNNKSNTFSLSVQLYPAPTLTSHSPSSAQEGSTLSSITLYGTNFRKDTAITNKIQLGSSTSARFDCTYSSTSRLYCYKIPLTGFPQGTLDIRAVNPDGQTSNARQITITAPSAPRITSVSPLTGINNQTVKLTIRGSYFNTASKVLLGTKSFAVTTYSSASSIQVDVDLTTFTQGIYPLLIRNTIGGKDYDSNAYNFVVTDPPTPEITYFTPMVGETTKKVTVNIYGSEFNAGSKVLLNNVAQTVSSPTSTRLTVEFDLTSVTPGKYTLVVDNGGGKKSIASYFHVVKQFAPVITRLNPAGLNHTSSNTTITIDGRNFDPQATVTLGGSAVGLASKTSTRLTFASVFPKALYPHDSKNVVKVTNPDGQSAQATLHIFNTSHPVISYLSPASARPGSSVRLYTYGRYLNVSPRYIYFDGVQRSVQYAGSSYAYTTYFTIGSAAKTADVYVMSGGKKSNTLPFIIGEANPPTITYINPSSGKTGSSISINLRGSYFVTSPMAQVYFDGKAYTPTGSTSSLTVTIPLTGATVGSKEVYIRNHDGQVSHKVLFSVYQ